MNTQIDVIFTKSYNVSSGIYETFFSYHKPIFVVNWKESIAMGSNMTTNVEKGAKVKECADTIVTRASTEYAKGCFGKIRKVRKLRNAVTVSESQTPQTCNKTDNADITTISCRRSSTLAPATFTYNL